jgi:HlyD family secretion protein
MMSEANASPREAQARQREASRLDRSQQVMDAELRSLRIDRTPPSAGSKRARRRLVICFALATLAGYAGYAKIAAPIEVEIVRVAAPSATRKNAGTVLNATGYVVAAHKIELAAKVVGRVAWIGVDRGDSVKEGQELVRLENEEYRARVGEAEGQIENLQARLAELENGSRPEEIGRARADLDRITADLTNARIARDRTRSLVSEGLLARQTLDDVEARHESLAAQVRSAENSYRLVRTGPRTEEIAALRGTLRQAQGNLAFARNQLANTVIRAPISGTILERNVEKGEFVTTGFVGERGAKGYVVSIADLRDLEVELDISQNDFPKLAQAQSATVGLEAYPDRKYHAAIKEISPEANRQKATIQVKVKILEPDDFLRPDMSANVAFAAPDSTGSEQKARTNLEVPRSSERDGSVFVVSEGIVHRRPIKDLIGGEDVVLAPPENIRDGMRVKIKEKQ